MFLCLKKTKYYVKYNQYFSVCTCITIELIRMAIKKLHLRKSIDESMDGSSALNPGDVFLNPSNHARPTF